MATEALYPREIHYLLESIEDSLMQTPEIIATQDLKRAMDNARSTLTDFRFGKIGRLISFKRNSRRTHYHVGQGAYNPIWKSEQSQGMHGELALTELLKTALTEYRPSPKRQEAKEKQTRRELASGLPVSPETLAREFRRLLLMPTVEELRGERGEQLELARTFIGLSQKENYDFCLMGTYTTKSGTNQIVSQTPILFLPGINYKTPCDSQDSPLRALESLRAFCDRYAFPRKQ